MKTATSKPQRESSEEEAATGRQRGNGLAASSDGLPGVAQLVCSALTSHKGLVGVEGLAQLLAIRIAQTGRELVPPLTKSANKESIGFATDDK